MARVVEGTFQGKGLKIAVVVSRFNESVTKLLEEGALNELRRMGVEESDIEVVWVPGAFEIPAAVNGLVKAKEIDGLAALGSIIKGETRHHEWVAKSVSKALQEVAIHSGVPVGFGILTVDSLQQAFDRAGGKLGNRGRDAARSAVEMANLLRAIRAESKKEPAFKRMMAQEFKRT